MKTTITISAVDRTIAKKFVQFCLKNGMLYSDFDGDLHVHLDFDRVEITRKSPPKVIREEQSSRKKLDFLKSRPEKSFTEICKTLKIKI